MNSLPASSNSSSIVVRGLPHTRGVRSIEDSQRYGIGPTNAVPISSTEYWLLREEAMKADPVLWTHLVVQWDQRLVPAIMEALRVERQLEDNLQKRRAVKERRNEVILKRLEQLDEEEVRLRSRARAALHADPVEIEPRLKSLAASFARIKQVLDPNAPNLQTHDKSRLRSPVSHAARLQLPYEAEESRIFLSRWSYTFCTIALGAFFGISYLSVPGFVHPAQIENDPTQRVIYALVGGIALTALAGSGVRLIFRVASECFYLGRKWGPAAVIAVSVLILQAVLYAMVDGLGLMKASSSQAQIASLSGTRTASAVDPAYLLAAGAAAVFYMVYSAVTGWMKTRTAAIGRVTEAVENEFIEEGDRVREQPGFTEAVTELNFLSVKECGMKLFKRHHDAELESIHAEREKLLEELNEPITFSEQEILILDRARTEAEGRQFEFDELILALRQVLKGDAPAARSRAATSAVRRSQKPRGLWDWLRNQAKGLTEALRRHQ